MGTIKPIQGIPDRRRSPTTNHPTYVRTKRSATEMLGNGVDSHASTIWSYPGSETSIVSARSTPSTPTEHPDGSRRIISQLIQLDNEQARLAESIAESIKANMVANEETLAEMGRVDVALQTMIGYMTTRMTDISECN